MGINRLTKRHLFGAILVIGLAGCSQQEDAPAKPASKESATAVDPTAPVVRKLDAEEVQAPRKKTSAELRRELAQAERDEEAQRRETELKHKKLMEDRENLQREAKKIFEKYKLESPEDLPPEITEKLRLLQIRERELKMEESRLLHNKVPR